MRGKSAGGGQRLFLAGEGAGERQHRQHIGEASEEHREAERRVEPERIAAKAREGRAVIGRRRGEGVENFRQAVRTGIAEAVERGFEQYRRRREAEHGQRIDQHREHGEFHLARLDLLAEIFRRAPDHQPRDEHRDDHDYEKTIKTRADAAGEMQPSSMLKSGTSPPSGVNESCIALMAPVLVPVVAAAKKALIATPKRVSLPSILPAVGSTPISVSKGLPAASAQ